MIHFFFFVFMAVFFTVGLVLIGEARQKGPNHPACRYCKYNLTGLEPGTLHCPECGISLHKGTIRMPREPFTNTLMLAAGITMVLLSGPGCCLGYSILIALFGP